MRRRKTGLTGTQRVSYTCCDVVIGTCTVVDQIRQSCGPGETELYSDFRKSTIRLVLVPFRLLETPQQFAVLVNI